MKDWVKIAFEPMVMVRALKYAFIVGAILIAINHGDIILNEKLTLVGLIKIGLTVLVPYIVSTSSSVGAIRESSRNLSKGHQA